MCIFSSYRTFLWYLPLGFLSQYPDFSDNCMPTCILYNKSCIVSFIYSRYTIDLVFSTILPSESGCIRGKTGAASKTIKRVESDTEGGFARTVKGWLVPCGEYRRKREGSNKKLKLNNCTFPHTSDIKLA